jgi:pimeloyl-ACP methyl ester carboxylesterase
MKLWLQIVLIVLLLLVIGLGAWLYTPDRSRSELEAKYGVAPADYLEVAGVRLRLRRTGPPGAPAVILLHGFGASLDTWEPWSRILSADYDVIRFDLPGFGLTGPDPTGDYTDARSMAVLLAVMDRLGIARASVIGNSLGGKIAWMFAAKYPERVQKLVLISPDGFASPGFEYGVKPKVPALFRLLRFVLPRAAVRMSMAPAFADPAHMSEDLVTRYSDMMRAPGVRGAMLARMEQAMVEPPEATLASIRTPTMLLWGEKDGMIPFSNSADYMRLLPNATLVALPELGHVPHEEAPAVSLPPVQAFLGK